MWPTLRDFLSVPDELTGRGVRIAIVDGDFPSHPDITTNEQRTTYKVMVMEPEPQPKVFEAESGPWKGGAHGLWAAAAAAGSGAESQGLYRGIAPEADLFLIAEYFPGQSQDPEGRYAAHIKALEWVRDNWSKHEIRAVLSARRCGVDSSLLPWQTEPTRILCEEIAAAGVLVMSGSGNHSDRTAGLTEPAAPSVFSVGGIVISPDGDLDRAEAFPGSRGTTFEGKWIPEILAPAENVVLPHGTDEEIENHFYDKIDDLPRRYARTLGTSFSGPIALGAAACVWQAHPNWTALDMKTALIASSIKRPQWSNLRAGLVSVEGALAMKATEHPPEPVTSPYQIWSEWRKRSVEYRMDQLSAGDSDQVRDIILSFVGDLFPDAALQPISECLNHPKSEVRAAALCVLASKASEVNPDYIKEGCRDVSPIVRSAAVYLLQNCPALWSECSASLSVLFNDPSLDVRYVSFNLARRMAHPRFAEEIVSGLEEDARMGRIANFAARRDALEAITGHRLPERPPYYVHGQPYYSDARRDARVDMARRWEDWLRQDWPSRA
ncbi:MAG: S8 family serine peptidase [Gemmatimonadetes bacterium]|nr:S8 family serine peptidase [Gemmatimonadota bacterium]MYC74131.1 S8 family serine peptidase [Gemmatimonadota bacterium]MYI62039.1 S8 family serine peptidase [Gemmatimonadota bacterium]